MELTFELTAEDLDAFYRQGNASAWGLLAFEWSLVIAGLVVVDWFFFRKWPVVGIIVNAVAIGVYVGKNWRKRHATLDRNVRSLVKSRDGLVATHRLSMSSEGYEHSVGPARVAWRWQQVKRVTETEDHFFLRVGVAGATIVPKRAFCDASQLKWFRDRLGLASQS